MKNLIIALALLLTTTANAQTPDTTKLKATITICETNPQKVMIAVSNPSGEKISVEVYTTSDGYLLQKITKVNDYRASLDFSTAVDGEYTVEVSCRNGEKVRKTVRMETKEMILRTATFR